MSEHIDHPEHWCAVCGTRVVGSNGEMHPCPFNCDKPTDGAA